jgi:hypothetical protein
VQDIYSACSAHRRAVCPLLTTDIGKQPPAYLRATGPFGPAIPHHPLGGRSRLSGLVVIWALVPDSVGRGRWRAADEKTVATAIMNGARIRLAMRQAAGRKTFRLQLTLNKKPIVRPSQTSGGAGRRLHRTCGGSISPIGLLVIWAFFGQERLGNAFQVRLWAAQSYSA